MANDYVELAGRTYRKEPTRTIFRTVGVATLETDTSAPKRKSVLAPDTSGGSTYSGQTHAIPPICLSVDVNETQYPGRFLFTATYAAPVTRAEFQQA